MTSKELIKYLQNPQTISQASLYDVEQLYEQYPYCSAIAILYLKALADREDLKFNNKLKKIALSVYSRERLHEITYLKAEVATPEIKNSEIKQVASAYSIEDIPIKTKAQDFKGQSLIDKFIESNPKISPISAGPEDHKNVPIIPEIDISESIFTESLAKIYIRQKQYDKAKRIFEKLNLKFPEKSSYFADQIEKIDKLITNN
jgi:tetratricopeptide (TPR) repeat protein